MMTKFLSISYAGLIELFMWLLIIAGIIGGVKSSPTDNEFVDGTIGFFVSAVLTAFFFGPILILIEIRKLVGNSVKVCGYYSLV